MNADTPAERYLSIADLSRMLALPESTTRYYCKRFAEHLPHAGEGRRRRYAPECVAVLKTVMAEMHKSKNAFAVDLALNKASADPAEGCGQGAAQADLISTVSPVPSVPMNAEPETESLAQVGTQIMTLLERQTASLQEIASAMTLLASRQLATYQEEAGRLREEMGAVRDAMAQVTESQKKGLEQTRTWLARFSEALVNPRK